MKLSIIIPIYKVEMYISRCIQSCIVNDKIQNSYEIIVVNDGTPDKSADIAIEVCRDYPNVHIISKPNGGLSSARNVGLKNAKGDYIWFVDSDDSLTPNAIDKVLAALNSDIDLLELQYQLTFEDGREPLVKREHIWEGIKTGTEVVLSGGLSTPAQFTIYRRNLLEEYDLRFVEGIYHEDSEFKPRVLYRAKKCKSLDFVAYNYLQRSSGSITSSFSLKRGKDSIFVMNSLYNFAKKNVNGEVFMKYFFKRIGLTMNSLLQGIDGLSAKERKALCFELSSSPQLFKALRHSGDKKYFIEGVLLSLSVNLTLYMYKTIVRS